MATNAVTPGASTAAPSFSGMSLSDAVDSLSVPDAGGDTSADTTQDTGADTAVDAAAPEATDTPELAEGEQPAEAPAPEVEPEIGLLDEIKPDRETDGGKTLHFNASKAKALLAARDFQARVNEAYPGATIEDIADNYRRSVEIDRMLTDHESGDPGRVGGVIDTWVNPQTNPQTLMAFADHVPAKLSQSNPQAFQRLESNILSNWLHQSYQRAAQSGDQRMLEVAQNLDFILNGKFRPADQLKQQAADPLARERQQFNLERNQFNQQRAQERQQWVAQQMAAKDDAVNTAVTAEISKPLQAKGQDGKTIEERLAALPGGGELKEFVANRLQAKVDEAD
jgi:hypothetical protein